MCVMKCRKKKKRKVRKKGKIKRVGKEKKNASGVFFPGFSGGGDGSKGWLLNDVVSLA